MFSSKEATGRGRWFSAKDNDQLGTRHEVLDRDSLSRWSLAAKKGQFTEDVRLPRWGHAVQFRSLVAGSSGGRKFVDLILQNPGHWLGSQLLSTIRRFNYCMMLWFEACSTGERASTSEFIPMLITRLSEWLEINLILVDIKMEYINPLYSCFKK